MSDIIQKQIPIEVIPASELSKSEFNERFFIPGKLNLHLIDLNL